MHIFLATDGSPSARLAQEHILALPWAAPVHVTVMMALDIPHPRFTSLTPMARRAYGAASAAFRQEAEAQAREVLAQGRCALEPHVDSVATRMQEGSPGALIVETARACRADLVGVGSRGLGALKGFLLGSVSKHVVYHAHCSVLLAKCPPGRAGRFLLALDGSARSLAALRWLTDLCLPPEAWIHVISVLEFPKAPSNGPTLERRGPKKAVLGAGLEAHRAAAEGLVGEASRQLAAQGVRVTATVRRGRVASEVLAAAREFGPDLLILGAKGQHSPPDLPLGTVARKIVDRAPCSTLIVRS